MRDSSNIKAEKRNILLWFNVLAALLIIGGGAYSRGLYYSQEFLFVNGIVGILSLVTFPVVLGNRSFKVDFLDAAILAIGLTYIISLIGAATLGTAIQETMRVWTYILFYFMLSRSMVNRSLVRVYALGLVLVGAIIALLGIMTVPGWFIYAGSWTDTLGSTLQYHNAFASFIVGIMILAIYFWLEEARFIPGTLLGVGIFIMALALAGSQSRGGYLIFLAAVLAMFFIYPAGKRRNLLFPILNFFIGLILWGRFLAAATSKSTNSAILWLIVGCVLAFLLTLAKNTSNSLERRFSKKAINIAFVLLGIVLIGVGIFVFMRHGGDVLAKIKQINLQAHSVQERFTWYSDAWKMFLASPLTGYGGGGWMTAYKGFQSYLYYSNETHSIVTKILVETGILGIAALVALVIAVVRLVIKSTKELKSDVSENFYRVLNLVVFLSFLAIGGHAIIDFDLSEGAVSLLLWGMLALLKATDLHLAAKAVRNQEQSTAGSWRKYLNQSVVQVEPYQPADPNRKYSFPVMVSLTILAAVLLIAPFFIWNETNNSQIANNDLQKQNYAQAVKDSQAAIQSFPFDYYPWAQAAQANYYMLMSSKNGSYQGAAITDIKRAVELNRFDPDILTNEAQILGGLGQYQEAFTIGQKIIPLAPFYNKSYESFGQIALQYSINELQSGNKDAARNAAKEVVSIPQNITAKVNNLAPYYKNLWVVPDKLDVTSVIRLQGDLAKLLLGDLTAGKDLEGMIRDQQVGASARMWLAGLATKNGDKAAAANWTQGLTSQQQSQVAPIAGVIGTLQ